jgi:cardiolipin synthase
MDHVAGLLRRLLRRVALAVVAAQAVTAGALIAVDSWRKRMRPREATFPRTEAADLPLGESTVTVYTYGTALYEDMLASIEGAQERVLFESFIVKDDEVGQRFKTALIAAAERGVEVFVIYDVFANLVVRRAFFDFPPSVNVVRYPALKPGMLLLDVRKSGRDHRKLLVVDGEIGFVGGYNIGSAYATQWRDTHLRVRGPSAWELENAFIDFWNQHRAPVPSQLIYPIRGMYLEAIDRASEHISITQPYFIPDRTMVRALLAAARRGVDVRVLVPAASNHVITDWLSRGFYAAFLRGGVTIWRFERAMIHAKTMTVDGRWSTIGTANIDRLSLTGNYEVNVEIFDRGVAQHLERVFATDLSNASQLTTAEWERRGTLAKLTEQLLAPLRPLL